MDASRSTLSAKLRHSIAPLAGEPTVVSLSDVHGHLEAARSALLAPADHPDFDPVVTIDSNGRLEWAGNDYVLAFNGDLVNRGPDSAAVLELVDCLRERAPAGRVRYNIGNHETGLFFRDVYPSDDCFTARATESTVRAFLESVLAGRVTVAFEGHRYVHTHAGHPDGVDPVTANEALAEAASRLLEGLGTEDDERIQRAVYDAFPNLFAAGRDASAGCLWLKLERLPADAPRQLVGHTPSEQPRRNGNMIAGDLIGANLERDGGEGVLLERPGEVLALTRSGDGDVERTVLERG
ncbi:metallophosphoesterase [Halobacteria archaeon AArc-m2/3/4]|uniref:Metallophosphoesterase n=1 Tax=Natronoglomus mannanivorans TaxID=2979990 RepID=A0ABT2QHG9_9EURY|nr:metallophosphoesterase [Halobacteria archaeon AArc-m2/3/4]